MPPPAPPPPRPTYPPPAYQPYPIYPQPKQTNSTAIVGLVLAFIFPLVGLILSIVAHRQCTQRNENGQGTALAGIIISIIRLIISFAFWMFVIIGIIYGDAYFYINDSITHLMFHI